MLSFGINSPQTQQSSLFTRYIGALQDLVVAKCKFFQQVHAFQQFQELVYFAPRVIAALSQTGLIGQFKIMQLYDALRSDRCRFCSGYAPYLYLLGCTRFYYPCLMKDPHFCTTSSNTAMNLDGLISRELESLPTLKVIPDFYGAFAAPWM